MAKIKEYNECLWLTFDLLRLVERQRIPRVMNDWGLIISKTEFVVFHLDFS